MHGYGQRDPRLGYQPQQPMQPPRMAPPPQPQPPAQPQPSVAASLAQLLKMTQQAQASSAAAAPPPHQQPQNPPQPAPSAVDGCKLYVRAPAYYDQHDIQALFQPFGRIRHTHYERKNGAASSTGFVDFESRADAETAAREMNGQRIDGFAIAVR
jgi:hypothetical protein